MKVTFNKNELTSALDRVQRAAQTKINSNTNNGFFISAATRGSPKSLTILGFRYAPAPGGGSIEVSYTHLQSL